jgi:hypothetical protein
MHRELGLDIDATRPASASRVGGWPAYPPTGVSTTSTSPSNPEQAQLAINFRTPSEVTARAVLQCPMNHKPRKLLPSAVTVTHGSLERNSVVRVYVYDRIRLRFR